MTRRPLIAIAALAAGFPILGFACGPLPPPKPQCGPYSLVYEAKPMPCIVGKGDRVDFIMSGPVTPASSAAVKSAAVTRCVNVPLVGAAYWLDRVPGNVASRVLVCRTAGV